MLVFPGVVKVGFGIGGEYGEGALLKGDETLGYYSISGASFGLQVGAQSTAQIIVFMNFPENSFHLGGTDIFFSRCCDLQTIIYYLRLVGQIRQF